MTELTAILDSVSNVAFPIAACVILWYGNREQIKQYREDVSNMRNTVEKNTQTIETLKEIMRELRDRLI